MTLPYRCHECDERTRGRMDGKLVYCVTCGATIGRYDEE